MEFSYSPHINRGWELFKKHWGYVLGVTILYLIIGNAFSLLSIVAQSNSSEPSGLSSSLDVVSNLWAIFLAIGITRLYFALFDKDKEDFALLFSGLDIYLRYLGASILIGLIVVGGLILFIIPGIYFALKYQFAFYLIIDKNMRVRDSMRLSAKMTKGVKMKLLGFSFVIGLINLVGLLLFGVGLLVTIPVSGLANLSLYRHFEKNMKVSASVPTTSGVVKGKKRLGKSTTPKK